MPNPRLINNDYVQTVSFTLRSKDLKFLDIISKKHKNRSSALRFLLDDAQHNMEFLKKIEKIK